MNVISFPFGPPIMSYRCSLQSPRRGRVNEIAPESTQILVESNIVGQILHLDSKRDGCPGTVDFQIYRYELKTLVKISKLPLRTSKHESGPEKSQVFSLRNGLFLRDSRLYPIIAVEPADLEGGSFNHQGSKQETLRHTDQFVRRSQMTLVGTVSIDTRNFSSLKEETSQRDQNEQKEKNLSFLCKMPYGYWWLSCWC